MTKAPTQIAKPDGQGEVEPEGVGSPQPLRVRVGRARPGASRCGHACHPTDRPALDRRPTSLSLRAGRGRCRPVRSIRDADLVSENVADNVFQPRRDRCYEVASRSRGDRFGFDGQSSRRTDRHDGAVSVGSGGRGRTRASTPAGGAASARRDPGKPARSGSSSPSSWPSWPSAGSAAFFMSQTYTSPNPRRDRGGHSPLGTAVVERQDVPHVALRFQTYPDSTGFGGRQGRSIPAAIRAGPPTDSPTSSRCRPTRW